MLALQNLADGGESDAYNLGSEKGYSVLEIIEAAEMAVGRKIDYAIAPRRAGDPVTLIASSEKIQKALGWQPKFGIDDILRDAWRFHKHHPDGYQ